LWIDKEDKVTRLGILENWWEESIQLPLKLLLLSLELLPELGQNSLHLCLEIGVVSSSFMLHGLDNVIGFIKGTGA